MEGRSFNETHYCTSAAEPPRNRVHPCLFGNRSLSLVILRSSTGLLQTTSLVIFECDRSHPALDSHLGAQSSLGTSSKIACRSTRDESQASATMSAHAQDVESTFKPFTKAERIRQLNDIDKSIASLLRSAGLALQTLGSVKSSDMSDGLQDKRQQFQDRSNDFLRTLQSVDIRLRRQIDGLEEAGIIPAGPTSAKPKPKEASGASMGAGMAGLQAGQSAVGGDKGERLTVAEGQMGKLDIGWLNSRSGSVDRNMEAELWQKARTFMEKVTKEEAARGGADSTEDGGDEGNSDIMET